MSDFKALKFQVGSEVKVTLKFDTPRISESTLYPGKQQIWYGIKPTISGENGFNATEKLHGMISLVGAGRDDEITISKMQGDKFTYFLVNGMTEDELKSNHRAVTSSTSGSDVVVQSSSSGPSDKEKLDILWKAHEEKNSIPF